MGLLRSDSTEPPEGRNRWGNESMECRRSAADALVVSLPTAYAVGYRSSTALRLMDCGLDTFIYFHYDNAALLA